MGRRQHRQVTRVVRGELYTPVQTWVREPGHRVVLVGLSHVGEVAYYRTIGRAVEAQGEATVLYGRLVREDPSPAMTDQEGERLVARRRSGAAFMRLWAAEVGGMGTGSGLPVGAEWRNVDVSEVDLLRMSGRNRWPVVRIPGIRIAIDFAADMSRTQRQALERLVRLALVRVAPGGRWAMRPRVRRAVVHCRTVQVMTHALRAVHNRQVVVVWHAEHLPGMGDLLSRNGFRLDSVRWVRAIGRMSSPGDQSGGVTNRGRDQMMSTKVQDSGLVAS